jgi:hypothetical protein
MKKLLLPMLISIALFSCTRQLDSSAVSTSVTDAAVHGGFTITWDMAETVQFTCLSEEMIQFSGQGTMRYNYTERDILLGHVVGIIRFKDVKGIGLTTGHTYILQSHELVSASIAPEDYKYSDRYRFTVRCKETGITFKYDHIVSYLRDNVTQEFSNVKSISNSDCND